MILNKKKPFYDKIVNDDFTGILRPHCFGQSKIFKSKPLERNYGQLQNQKIITYNRNTNKLRPQSNRKGKKVLTKILIILRREQQKRSTSFKVTSLATKENRIT